MSAEDIRFLTKKGDNAYNTRFDASMSVGGRKIQVGDGMSLKQVETLQNQGFSADDIRFYVNHGDDAYTSELQKRLGIEGDTGIGTGGSGVAGTATAALKPATVAEAGTTIRDGPATTRTRVIAAVTVVMATTAMVVTMAIVAMAVMMATTAMIVTRETTTVMTASRSETWGLRCGRYSKDS